MSRLLYAPSPADYAADATGAPQPAGVTLQVYDAIVSGTHITDLLAADGATPITAATTDDKGGFRFYGPDGFQSDLYVEDDTGQRYEVHPVGMMARVLNAEGAQGEAQAYADQLLADHVDQIDNPDPHPQYTRMLGAAAGARIWGGATFPTAADGAQDGDYLFYEG